VNIQMEFEFDKEMDALLRKAAKSGLAETAADSHLDADEISMFAENAMPDAARSQAISHMADCGRCRTILSNVAVLNAGAENITATSPEVLVTTESTAKPSWIAGLFSTRNLAFGFGGLALVFAGLLSISVFRTMYSGPNELAKADQNEIPNAAKSVSDPAKEVSDSLGAANSNVETNADSASQDSKQEGTDGVFEPNTSSTSGRENVRMKTPQPEKLLERKDLGRLRDAADLKSADDIREMDADLAPGKPAAKQAAPPAPAPPPPPKSVEEESVLITRGERSKPNRSVDKADASVDKERRAANKPVAAGASMSSNRTRLNGKTFNRIRGVWYDSAYKQQSTTNVKRNTEAFNKLDSGVKTIANKLSGTVVVVWKTKAYRID
jgi:hypothetical protein